MSVISAHHVQLGVDLDFSLYNVAADFLQLFPLFSEDVVFFVAQNCH